MEWMELKEGCAWVCWLVMAGSAGEKPWAAEEEEEEVVGGHPELLPPGEGTHTMETPLAEVCD